MSLIPDYEQTAGALFLRIPEHRNVFYSEHVKFAPQIYDLVSFYPLFKSGKTSSLFWMSGTKDEFFHIEVDMEATLIEGFYVDHTKVEDLSEYKVTIYLEIEL